MWSSDPATSSTIKLIVGLGNPGPQYYGTRHNAGFLLVDALVERWSAVLVADEKHFLVWRCQRESSTVYLMKPLTYMNLSGLALAAFLNQVALEPQDVLVVYDDIALETGSIRIRAGGTSGGQKGLQHIIETMGEKQIPRLRLGVGIKPNHMSLSDYVLSEFEENQLEAFSEACSRGCLAAEDWLKDSMQTVMSRYNARVPIKKHSQEEKTTPVEGGE